MRHVKGGPERQYSHQSRLEDQLAKNLRLAASSLAPITAWPCHVANGVADRSKCSSGHVSLRAWPYRRYPAAAVGSPSWPATRHDGSIGSTVSLGSSATAQPTKEARHSAGPSPQHPALAGPDSRHSYRDRTQPPLSRAGRDSQPRKPFGLLGRCSDLRGRSTSPQPAAREAVRQTVPETVSTHVLTWGFGGGRCWVRTNVG